MNQTLVCKIKAKKKWSKKKNECIASKVKDCGKNVFSEMSRMYEEIRLYKIWNVESANSRRQRKNASLKKAKQIAKELKKCAPNLKIDRVLYWGLYNNAVII